MTNDLQKYVKSYVYFKKKVDEKEKKILGYIESIEHNSEDGIVVKVSCNETSHYVLYESEDSLVNSMEVASLILQNKRNQLEKYFSKPKKTPKVKSLKGKVLGKNKKK